MIRSIFTCCRPLPFLLAFLLLLPGCQTAYFKTMEKFGYHKRDILVSRVEDARDAQHEAKDQFRSALARFAEVTGFKGGSLEEKYTQLDGEYQASKVKSDAVSSRIASVEDVAGALFEEWEGELDQYSSDSLRRSSRQKLDSTRGRYRQLIAAMKKAEAKIAPVMTAFNDQVLFLKHNLNAQAIASLRDELASVETDISALIREMEVSIREADAFISAMASE
ncbi:DUF2959 domain-containing protein [Trichloromonas sp.]|uniref:DUF2959 domain-containing protein n=1 Tax=Trichloromonas sp. TaxID=3069249 RepID=UPI003D817D27